MAVRVAMVAGVAMAGIAGRMVIIAVTMPVILVGHMVMVVVMEVIMVTVAIGITHIIGILGVEVIM